MPECPRREIPFEIRKHGFQLIGETRLVQHQAAAHFDNRIHVFDHHRALLHTRHAGRARPEFLLGDEIIQKLVSQNAVTFPFARSRPAKDFASIVRARSQIFMVAANTLHLLHGRCIHSQLFQVKLPWLPNFGRLIWDSLPSAPVGPRFEQYTLGIDVRTCRCLENGSSETPTRPGRAPRNSVYHTCTAPSLHCRRFQRPGNYPPVFALFPAQAAPAAFCEHGGITRITQDERGIHPACPSTSRREEEQEAGAGGYDNGIRQLLR
jgi:hypothetical protein